MHKCNETKSFVSVSEGSNPATQKQLFSELTVKVDVKRRKVGRGMNKQKWTKEERVVLWECYVRSGGRGCLRVYKRIMEMWDGRDVGIRSQASVPN